jgi:hypothetical protein
MRWHPGYLFAALLIFLASAALILVSLERNSTGFALLGAMGNVLAAILFVLSIWFPRRKVDWSRIEAEQRLWESGPLGRKWLRVRKRIYNRWKF